ncbi:MAG: zinc-binding dehydrogenase [Desulfobacterales bacterium]|nr:MAG: zinc-binding dehydrogenase [Desulfobacterales bacterium]
MQFALRIEATAAVNAAQVDVLQKIPEILKAADIDVVYNAVGVGATARQSIELVKHGGTLVWIGLSNDEEKIPIGKIVFKEIDIRGMFRYANMYPRAINLVQKGIIDLKSLITKRVAFEEIPAIMPKIANGEIRASKP